jgi:hypothetical protein
MKKEEKQRLKEEMQEERLKAKQEVLEEKARKSVHNALEA